MGGIVDFQRRPFLGDFFDNNGRLGRGIDGLMEFIEIEKEYLEENRD